MEKSIIALLIVVLTCTLPVFAGVHHEAGSTIIADNMGNTALPKEIDDLSSPDLVEMLQDKGSFNLSPVGTEISAENFNEEIARTYSPNSDPELNQVLLAQSNSEELSHQALTTAMQASDMFYYVSASGSLPILDQTFRDFIDYGAMVSFGTGKRIKDNLSITASIGVGMMTGDWSIGGDRQSITVAAEQYYPGYVMEPGIVITPEDLPDDNLGVSYHGDAEAIITSSESLKSIDVHTDLYLFPVSINAKYIFKQADRFHAYAGGGLGFCVASRDCDSRAIKEKYFSGPDYKVSLNKTQTVTGLLVNLVAGVDMPINDKLKFVAEASTTLYDLNAFDPVLEISFTKPNPAWYTGSDLSQWSYEDPLRVGVYKEVYVTNIAAGFVMPF